MIQVILGSKGSGKTKRLLDMTNDALKTESGEIVFIDNDKRYMFDLRHEIRFVDAREYRHLMGCTPRELLCFLSGMLASNYDISLVSVDAFLKIVKTDLGEEEMQDFFGSLQTLSDAHNCSFLFSISADESTAPACVRRYAV